MSRSNNSHKPPRTTYAPMSLATRCTECKTIFRVMEDQLRVSEGWVRCGRCGSVFNGLASLLQLKRDAIARPTATPEAHTAESPSELPRVQGLALSDEAESSAVVPHHGAQTEADTNLLQKLGGYFLGTAAEKKPPAQPDQHFAASSSLPSESAAQQAWRDSYLDDWVAETATGVLDVVPEEPVPAQELGDANAWADLSADAELAPPLQSLLKKPDSAEPSHSAPPATPVRPPFRQALPPLTAVQAPLLTKASKNRHGSKKQDGVDQASGFLPSWSAPEGPLTELVPPPSDQNESSDEDDVGRSSASKRSRRAKAHKSRQKRSAESAPTAAKEAAGKNLLWHSAKEDPPPSKNAKLESSAEKEQASTSATLEPSFVRRAQSQALWRSARVRATLAASAVLLSTTLALQVATHWRDVLAARWPQAQPWLVQTCMLLGGETQACEIQAPKRIANISVESTTLVNGDAPNTYQLNLVLRNRSSQVVALPAIELNITNNNNELIARRALSPSHFRAESETLPGSAEMAMSLFFKSEVEPVSGYTVEAFYP